VGVRIRVRVRVLGLVLRLGLGLGLGTEKRDANRGGIDEILLDGKPLGANADDLFKGVRVRG
jgi:hypothetical protein